LNLIGGKKIMKTTLKSALLAVGLAVAASSASASVILAFGAGATSSNSPNTGASGKATLSFSDVVGGVGLSVLVENTTGDVIFGAGATTSKLTGFAFDLDGLSIDFGSFVGGTYLTNLLINADAQPFGTFDLAVADNDNYNGGNANSALPQGLSDTFSLTLTGGANAAAVEASFLSFFEGSETSAMRFQQVNAGAGSDKLTDPDVTTTDIPPAVPLPAAGWMLIAGIGGIAAMKRRKKA
jgi:hypothetical protein